MKAIPKVTSLLTCSLHSQLYLDAITLCTILSAADGFFGSRPYLICFVRFLRMCNNYKRQNEADLETSLAMSASWLQVKQKLVWYSLRTED